eukprot:15366995-Ditylum_brightwellii.AAC.1
MASEVINIKDSPSSQASDLILVSDSTLELVGCVIVNSSILSSDQISSSSSDKKESADTKQSKVIMHDGFAYQQKRV